LSQILGLVRVSLRALGGRRVKEAFWPPFVFSAFLRSPELYPLTRQTFEVTVEPRNCLEGVVPLQSLGFGIAGRRSRAATLVLLLSVTSAQHFALAASSSGATSPQAAKSGTAAPDHSDKTKATKTSPPAQPVVTLVEFSDFECPYCAKMVAVVDQVIQSYPPGKVRLIVKDFPLPIHAGSELAHEACLAAKAQGKYWEMYHLLFANQQRLQESDLLEYAKQVRLDVASFENALKTHRYRAEIEDNKAEATALGVMATPTFFVNGQKLTGAQTAEVLKQRVEEALGLVTPSGPPSGTKETRPAPEGILANSPVRGSPDAVVSITEFADFQCPYCASARSALDQVLREYPHKVKLVYRNFPLDFHPDSMLAHHAAMAAGEQGKFWEMHDLIFSHQRAMKRDDLFSMARSLGLDMDRFATDLQSDKVQREISADREDGKRQGVSGTPTFYVEGEELVGAASVAQFEGMITRALVAKGIPADKAPIVAEAGPARGPEHAPVTVLWYSDVTSPLAIAADRLMEQLLEAYPRQVRVVYKNRPLEFHKDAALAHQALVAAGAQGKFWPMHRAMLVHQGALSATDLTNYAADLGLDTNRFLADMTGQVAHDQVQSDVSQAREAGVNGVPVFVVNGTRVDGIQPLSSLKAIVDEQIQKTNVAAVHE
jgi:protein-disulfide isomerase